MKYPLSLAECYVRIPLLESKDKCLALKLAEISKHKFIAHLTYQTTQLTMAIQGASIYLSMKSYNFVFPVKS